MDSPLPFRTFTVDGHVLQRAEILPWAEAFAADRQGAPWAMAVRDTLHALLTGNGDLPVRTSGTTGPPKAMVVPGKDLVASARLTGATFGLRAGDRALCCLPCDLIAGKMMLVRSLVLGLDLHLVDPQGPLLPDDPTQHFRFAAMVPLQVQRLLDRGRERVEAAFDILLLGGGPVSLQLMRDVATLTTRVCEGYGSTETVTHVALRGFGGEAFPPVFEALGTVSFAQDERGCLVVRTPHLSVRTHVTNDVVELLDSRRFRWLGRSDNVILSSGRKILPEQLEERTASVLPYPHYFTGIVDERAGQGIVLVLETTEDLEAIRRDVEVRLRTVLERHELPWHIRTVVQFARTASGKIIRG